MAVRRGYAERRPAEALPRPRVALPRTHGLDGGAEGELGGGGHVARVLGKPHAVGAWVDRRSSSRQQSREQSAGPGTAKLRPPSMLESLLQGILLPRRHPAGRGTQRGLPLYPYHCTLCRHRQVPISRSHSPLPEQSLGQGRA